MNLNFAAQFLDESIYLTEDADSKGREKTIKWLKNNFALDQYGMSATDNAVDDNDNPIRFVPQRDTEERLPGPNTEYIFRKAESFFGHPLNQGLAEKRKGINAFLPGATRIAITECGWLTKNVNEKMMNNLRYIYTALYFDYYDKRGPYHRDEEGHIVAEHPGYAGLCNYDFDGRSYDELMRDFGAMIPAAKERLEAQLDGAAIASATEEEESGPVERHAGEYHIEYIPDFDTSHTWFNYTNPVRSDYDGCHWCITHKLSYWHDYKDQYNGQMTIYFCWKAESKEALLEMNNHIYDYCPADASSEEIQKAPLNEYGTSLICIMVHPDENGDALFAQATSRYNHVGPDKEIYNEQPYSDNLVRKGDTAAICRILGISVEEFPSLFPIRCGSGDVDHSDIVRTVARLKNENKLSELFDRLDLNTTASREQLASSENNIVAFKDQGEYNLITHEGTIISPSEWFSFVKQLTPNVAVIKHINNTRVNFITGTGSYLLPRDVLNYRVLDNQANPNYALIEVRRGLWNIINLKTGAILLRKPVADIMLSNKYGRGIFVKKTADDAWEQIDVKGKTVFKLANNNPDTKPLTNIGNVALVKDNKNIVSVINTTNSRTLWKKKYRNVADVYVIGNSFIIQDNDLKIYDIVSPTGELIDTIRMDAFNLIVPSNYDHIKYCNIKAYILFKDLHHSNAIKIYDVGEKKFFEADGVELRKPIIFTSGVKVFETTDDDYYKIVGDSSGIISGSSPEFIGGALVINEDKEIYCVNDGRGNFFIMDCATGEILSNKFKNVTYGYADNDVYTLFLDTDNKIAELYDTDGNIIGSPITLWDNPRINGTKYIGQGCFLIQGGNDGKYNIINSEGKLLFKMPFTQMVSLGFSNNGVASIKAGRNTYFINTDFDVSRNVETLDEMFRNNDADLPLINESGYKKPVKFKTTTKLDLAAYLID